METTIHPAEAYLRNTDNPPYLYVRIEGKRRKLFINRDMNVIGIIAPRKRRQGYYFSNWTARDGYKPKTGFEVPETRKARHALERLASQDCQGRFGEVPLRKPHDYGYTHRRPMYPAIDHRKILWQYEHAPFQGSSETAQKVFYRTL